MQAKTNWQKFVPLNQLIMKNTIITFLLALSTTIANATTLTLNNAVPSPGQYTTWAAAQAAAVNGDTILVQGTTYNYFTLNVTKRLTIIGAGHNPTDKQNNQASFCDVVSFGTGAQGAKIFGMEIGTVTTANNDVDSVTVALCRITGALLLSHSQCEFWILDGCIFTNSGNCVNAQSLAFGDAIFQNNIFNGIIFAFNGPYIGYNYFNNNIFLGSNSYILQYCLNFYLNNNIFYRAGLLNYGNSNLTFNKNNSYQCLGGNTFPNGTNYENVNPLFVTNIGTGAFFTNATDYHLQTTSPLLNAGSDGTDLGVYGGNGDYDQGGVPRNPYIKTFNITGPSSINVGDNLQIYIKAKVRN